MQMTESKPIFKALKKTDLLSGDFFSCSGRNNKNTCCICVLEGAWRFVFFFFPPGKLNSTWQLPQQPIFVIYRIREQTRCRLSVNKFLLSLKVATYAVSFGQFINFCGVLFSSVLFHMLSLGISILFLGCIISKFRT